MDIDNSSYNNQTRLISPQNQTTGLDLEQNSQSQTDSEQKPIGFILCCIIFFPLWLPLTCLFLMMIHRQDITCITKMDLWRKNYMFVAVLLDYLLTIFFVRDYIYYMPLSFFNMCFLSVVSASKFQSNHVELNTQMNFQQSVRSSNISGVSFVDSYLLWERAQPVRRQDLELAAQRHGPVEQAGTILIRPLTAKLTRDTDTFPRMDPYVLELAAQPREPVEQAGIIVIRPLTAKLTRDTDTFLRMDPYVLQLAAQPREPIAGQDLELAAQPHDPAEQAGLRVKKTADLVGKWNGRVQNKLQKTKKLKVFLIITATILYVAMGIVLPFVWPTVFQPNESILPALLALSFLNRTLLISIIIYESVLSILLEVKTILPCKLEFLETPVKLMSINPQNREEQANHIDMWHAQSIETVTNLSIIAMGFGAENMENCQKGLVYIFLLYFLRIMYTIIMQDEQGLYTFGIQYGSFILIGGCVFLRILWQDYMLKIKYQNLTNLYRKFKLKFEEIFKPDIGDRIPDPGFWKEAFLRAKKDPEYRKNREEVLEALKRSIERLEAEKPSHNSFGLGF